MAEKVGTGFVPIKPDAKGFGPDLEKQLDSEGGPAAKRSGDKMALAMKGAFLAGAALIGKAVLDFGGFEKQMNEVFTLLPGISGEAMKEMSTQVKDFSTEFGVLPTEVVPALYQSLSAGVPKDNVFAFLETAQKLAKGGVTELATAVDGLSSVTNAYGTDVLSAQLASDQMFTTVKLGKTTISELSSSLFNVAPTAAGLGVTFGDVSAALATMTLAGVPTSVATTQLRSLLIELSKAGSETGDMFTEIAGKPFRQFIAEGGSVGGALDIMKMGAAEAGGALSDMFGSSEAASAAQIIGISGAEAYGSALTAMGDSAGATDAAFDTMEKGLASTLDKLKAKFSVALLNIGEQIAPTIGSVGEALGIFLEIFGKIPGPMQAAILGFATVAAGIFAFAKPIMNGIALFGKLGKVFSLLAANPWVLVVIALVAVTILIIKNWDKVKSALATTWGWITTAAKSAAEVFTLLWQASIGLVVAAWDWLFAKVTAVISFITTGVAGLGMAIADIFGAITSTIAGAWDTVTSLTSAAWATVTGIVETVGGAVVGFITGIPSAITSAFSTLAAVITAPFSAAFNGIKSLWNSTLGGFSISIPSWFPVGGGQSFTIPSMAGGGVLGGPQLFMGGDYPGAGSNPEIVAPQNIIRETVVEALSSADRGSGGLTVNGPLIGSATIRDDRDIVELSRELAREIDRRSRGAGKRTGGVMANV